MGFNRSLDTDKGTSLRKTANWIFAKNFRRLSNTHERVFIQKQQVNIQHGGVAQLGAQATGCAAPQNRNTMKIEKAGNPHKFRVFQHMGV